MSDATSLARAWDSVADAWGSSVDYVDEHSVAATTALLGALQVMPGERVLELCAGPGSLGADWSPRVGPTGTVVLSDFAPAMVAIARERNAHLHNVEVSAIDACAIDRPAGSFDVVACRMGLMFAPDPSVAFEEIHRVLAHGGRFGALTWGGVEHNPWMTCVGMAAMMHGVVSGGPPTGPGGIFSLSDPAQLAALADGAGFTDVSVEAIDISFRSATIGGHFDRVIALAGPLAAAFAAATPEQAALVRQTAADLAARYITQDGVDVPGRAMLVTAVR